MTTALVTLASSGATGKAHWTTVNGKRWLVAPTMALRGNIVVRPMNTTAPEFVPEGAISVDPARWDGAPILTDHPGGGYGSANDPNVMETMAFGFMKSTRYADGALRTEAWLDPVAAERCGPEAVDRIKRIEAGQMVDVSVGAIIAYDNDAGSYGGKDYAVTWSSIVTPDHLAFLPSGTSGACSIADGCGSPRVMSERRGLITRKELSMKNRGFIKTLKEVFGSTEPVKTEDMSDEEATVWSALSLEVDGFKDIEEFDPDASTVIYRTATDGADVLVRRSFSILTGEELGENVELGDDAEQVELVSRYENSDGEGVAVAALVGRRHSSADVAMLQSMHDNAVALGAGCPKTAAARKGLKTLAEIRSAGGGNPNHVPAGSPEGGQFAASPGGFGFKK